MTPDTPPKDTGSQSTEGKTNPRQDVIPPSKKGPPSTGTNKK